MKESFGEYIGLSEKGSLKKQADLVEVCSRPWEQQMLGLLGGSGLAY